MQFHTERNTFGLFSDHNISGTPHVSEMIFLDLHEQYIARLLVSETMMLVFLFLSFITLNLYKINTVIDTYNANFII